jgi:hypothetical protein
MVLKELTARFKKMRLDMRQAAVWRVLCAHQGGD